MSASSSSKAKITAIAAILAALNDLLTTTAERSAEAHELAQSGECNGAMVQLPTSIPSWTTPKHCIVQLLRCTAQKWFETPCRRQSLGMRCHATGAGGTLCVRRKKERRNARPCRMPGDAAPVLGGHGVMRSSRKGKLQVHGIDERVSNSFSHRHTKIYSAGMAMKTGGPLPPSLPLQYSSRLLSN